MQPARLPPQCHLIIRHCFELRHSGFVIFSVFFRNSSLVSVQEVRFRPLNTRKKSKIAVGATWPAPLAPLSFVSRVSWADVFFKIRKAMRGRIALTKRFPHTDGQREMPAESVPPFGKRTAGVSSDRASGRLQEISSQLSTRLPYRGHGRGCGVGRGLGVALGGAVAVAVAVGVGVEVRIGEGVGVGVAVGVEVGVGVGGGVTVGVTVGVGVPAPQGVALGTGLGATVGVGGGVPTAAAILTRPHP